MTADLRVETTPIPGLLVLRLPVHQDSRGWFKENWQRAKMTPLGLPDFGPVQNNISYNARRGATRGIHTEPWDKYVSVATGRVFAAWVDLREGKSFGATHHIEIDPGTAAFVPRGVGNAYQALEDGTSYTYLVNDHWRPGTAYPALHLGDPTAAIPWPIPLARSDISEKDRTNPALDEVTPMAPRRALVLGSAGQLGSALVAAFPGSHAVDRDTVDLADANALAGLPWNDYDVVLNAAAYTDVDGAESIDGRRTAWAVNASLPAALVRIVRDHRIVLVHYSSDYVFDGAAATHTEEEPLSPLGVYGQSKAAGDIAVAAAPRHYLLRTSWMVGEGRNFVRTMRELAVQGISPAVVADQVGRLTFTGELARATQHLLKVEAPYGTYNVTNAGTPTSWADLAKEVFRLSGRSPDDVRPVTTQEYAAGRRLAPRPANSVLDLDKLRAVGFEPEDAAVALSRHLQNHLGHGG